MTPSHAVLFMITQYKYTFQTIQGQMELKKRVYQLCFKSKAPFKTHIRKWLCKFFKWCLLWWQKASQRSRLLLLQLLALFIQMFHFANTYSPAAHCPKVNELVLCSDDFITSFLKIKKMHSTSRAKTQDSNIKLTKWFFVFIWNAMDAMCNLIYQFDAICNIIDRMSHGKSTKWE